MRFSKQALFEVGQCQVGWGLPGSPLHMETYKSVSPGIENVLLARLQDSYESPLHAVLGSSASGSAIRTILQPPGPEGSLPATCGHPRASTTAPWDCVLTFITQGEITLQTIFRLRHPCPCGGILSR